jgi:hypothetical protein
VDRQSSSNISIHRSTCGQLLYGRINSFPYQDSVVNRLNATTVGTYSYTAIDDSMELIKSWQLHQNPTSKYHNVYCLCQVLKFLPALDFYIVYSLGRTDAETWLSVVDKCTPNCAREGTLDVSAFATITANSTHWFACFKQVMSEGQVIQNGFYMCSTSSDLLGPIAVYPIDTDYPIKDTTGEDRMYSCMMDETTMILAVSSSDTQKYSLYSLDTSNIFNITSKTPTDGNGYIMSMSCRDQVILVATLNKIDYWVWDDGVSIKSTILGVSSQ